jgi:NHL repeat/WD40-like Beta Propeller Repeat
VKAIEHSTKPASGIARWVAFATGLVLFAGILAAAPVALGAPAVTFAAPGPGAGQVEYPHGVAVDQSNGTVYVADANERVDEFESAGHFLRAFGWGVLNGAAELQVCTTVCEANFEGRLRGSGRGQFNILAAIAVDQSSHDVYVGDFLNNRVEEFSPAGEFILMFGKGVDQTTGGDVCAAALTDLCGAGSRGTGPGELNTFSPMAFDASGNLWVGDENRLEQFSPEGAYLSEVPLPGAGRVGSLAVDTDPSSPSFGDFYTLKGYVGGVNEDQHFTRPNSGDFTLCFEGQCTPPLPHDGEHEADVQQALEALSTIGPGNVSDVLGIVHFTGSLAGTDVPQMTSVGATVETIRQGKPGVPGVISKRKPSGELVETIDASGHPNTLGLDPATGDLFVSDQFEGEANPGKATLLEFNPSGVQTEAFGFPQVIGAPARNALAFGDTAQRLYVVSAAAQMFAVPAPGPLPVEGSTRATEVRKRTGTLCSKLNPEGSSSTFHYQYIPEEQFVKDGASFGAGTLETSESTPVGEGFAQREACQPVSGLTPGTAYRFRIVARNANGTVDGETVAFQALPAVAIDSTSVTDVTATSATLHAEINPLGDATSYRFEYTSEAALLKNEAEGRPPFAEAVQVPLEPAAIGAGETDVSVAPQHLQGLVARTAYSYRVVAFNAIAPAGYAGATLAFTTQATGAFTFADGRQWELVSPPDKHGALLETEDKGGNTLQAAAVGDAATYPASFPTEAEAQDNANGAQVLSTRGPAGWSSRDVGPPYTHASGSTLTVGADEFRFFSADLSLAALHPQGGFSSLVSAEASEQTSYLRTNFPAGDPAHPCSEACFHPFVTGAEGFADVPPGTHFSTVTSQCPPGEVESECGPRFRGGTSDLAHVVLASTVALTSTPLPAKFFGSALYEWTAAAPRAERLRLVSVLPDGKPAVGAGVGGNGAVETRGSAISADGSRVVFHVGSGIEGTHLYLRYNATQSQSVVDGGGACTEPAMACTVQLDAVQGGLGSGNVNPAFQSASADGSVVYFTDEQRLTAGSGSSNHDADLYRCRIVEIVGRLGCELADLTPETSSAERARVQGAVLGGSTDGSSAYFVADSVLTGTERNEHGETAQSGSCGSSAHRSTCNLYLYRGGTVRFVAVLSGHQEDGEEDNASWGSSDGRVSLMSSRVSPDGRWLAFVSVRSLTGYDNRDALTGKRDHEIYLYDAESGRLRCVSCDPTGARPRGWEHEALISSNEELKRLTGDPYSWTAGAGLAAVLPGWPRPNYRSRLLSDSGRVFFESFDALVPQDSNGTWDVYEYEPPGVGDCGESSSTFSVTSGGCVSLISSGLSPESSYLVDASETGDDVFFYTNANLSASDVDTARDMYDAHVCGAGAPCPPPPPPPLPACEGDACQSPVAAPEDPTPGSLSFRGPGNIAISPPSAVGSKSLTRAQKLAQALRACQRKHDRAQRAVCRRRAQKSYGARRPGGAGAKRGGGK